ncbi:hypothetical protein H5410_001751 [Solanum commersonii]|uniref:Uncharacterized protein n=1 Tax=Solanum commersonii TaxID=4109 RepID=A0A9J6B0G2_SOLCO|nr:hypothetical protein H5410_001751 [Solanum commersonii]
MPLQVSNQCPPPGMYPPELLSSCYPPLVCTQPQYAGCQWRNKGNNRPKAGRLRMTENRIILGRHNRAVDESKPITCSYIQVPLIDRGLLPLCTSGWCLR